MRISVQQNKSGCSEEENNHLSLTGIESISWLLQIVIYSDTYILNKLK